MSDVTCPGCKANKYSNPSLKILVNICGHFLCKSCVEILFVRGSGSCPQCKTPLRRNDFRSQLFEDSSVEKEVDIRKKILKDFNKQEQDFISLEDFNNYLEMVEDLIFSLVNNIDVEEKNKFIEQYKKDNKEQIKKNRSKENSSQAELDRMIAEEYESKSFLKLSHEREKEEDRLHNLAKEKFIDDLLTSSSPASVLLSQDTNKQPLPLPPSSMGIDKGRYTSVSQKLKASGSEVFLSMPTPIQTVAAQPYSHVPYAVNMEGPALPDKLDTHIHLLKGRNNAQETFIAGFTHTMWASNLLSQAYCGLFSSMTSI